MTLENQPAPLAARNCENCAFAGHVRMNPTDIKAQLVCRWGPPSVVPMFTPQGLNLNVMFTPVSADILCNQHRLKKEIANANFGPMETTPN